VHWYTDGDMVRSAYTLRPDDDWAQAHTLVRQVIDEAARQRLVSNVTGHLRNGVSKEVLDRAFEYWNNIDKEVGDKIKTAVGNGSA
jgi:catalase